MFSLESTVSTEQWFAIKWQDSHGNTFTIERPARQAASRVAELFATPGLSLVSFTECDS